MFKTAFQGAPKKGGLFMSFETANNAVLLTGFDDGRETGRAADRLVTAYEITIPHHFQVPSCSEARIIPEKFCKKCMVIGAMRFLRHI